MTIVLVTGANGYIASFIVQDLLKHGYKVRGTVRSLKDESKYRHLYQLEHASENLELVEADLTVDGCFDAHVPGCSHVMHTASPFFFLSPHLSGSESASEAQRLLVDPAVNGTRNLMRAVEKCRHDVKRVVLTSSTAAVLSAPDRIVGRVYTEKDWNEHSSLTYNPYAYSKTCAEREAWRMWDEMRQKYRDEPTPIFELSTVNPTYVIGPLLQTERLKQYGVQELNTSLNLVRNFLLKRKLFPSDHEHGHKVNASEGWTIVDVRDVATIHRLVMETEDAGGHRFVTVAGKKTWAQFLPIIGDKFPELRDTMPNVVEGDVEAGYNALTQFENVNVQTKLGHVFDRFISVEQSMLDTVQSLKDNGLLQ